MRRVVLDTNVLVSGVLSAQGAPGKILALARSKELDLLFSRQTLAEAFRVLDEPRLQAYLKKRSLSSDQAKNFIKRLARFSVITPGKLGIPPVEADPSDTMFLVCAVEGQADFIVSGDHHLTDLGSYEGIPIVAPARFLELA